MAPYHEAAAESDSKAAFAYVKDLGSSAAVADIQRLLERGRVLERLSEAIARAAAELTQQAAATPLELHAKYLQEANTFQMSFGGLSTFFGGLEGLVGPPAPVLETGMSREHCESPDSRLSFTAPNYGTTTSSEIEWWFVKDPEKGKEVLAYFDEHENWPRESKLTALETADDTCAMRRVERSLESFSAHVHERNRLLRQMDSPALRDEEVVGGRLYTGPMYVKYNAVLRGSCRTELAGSRADATPDAALVDVWESLCARNRYPTTLHVINSVIVKLAKLTKSCKVYRGMSGGVLPERFWHADKQNVRGGIEFAFMSVTRSRRVAMAYASSDKTNEPQLLFEMPMGLIDRGADLSWLSQYPHESEILFAPLTGLEVQRTRVDGHALVVEMKLSVNLRSLTIEQVVSKMQRSQLELIDMLTEEADFAGTPPKALIPLRSLRERAARRLPSWFNNPENFKMATTEALDAQQQVFRLLARERSWVASAVPDTNGSIRSGTTSVTTHSTGASTPNEADLGADADDAGGDAHGGEGGAGWGVRSDGAGPSGDGTDLTDGAHGATAGGFHAAAVAGGGGGNGVLKAGDGRVLSPRALQLGLTRALMPVGLGRREPEMAARMRSTALLASRMGDHATAIALLRMSLARDPLRAKSSDHISRIVLSVESLRGPDGRSSLLVGPTGRDFEQRTWRLQAVMLLVEEGIMQPWPATVVYLMESIEERYQLGMMQAFAGLLRGRLDENAFALGGDVIVLHHDVWQPATIKREQPGKRYDVQLSDGTYLHGMRQEVVMAVQTTGSSAVLRQAARMGAVNLTRALLSKGVSPFVCDERARTALHYAAAYGHVEVARLLVDHGAGSWIVDKRKFSAYSEAFYFAYPLTLRVFLPAGSDLDVSPFAHESAAILSAAYDHEHEKALESFDRAVAFSASKARRASMSPRDSLTSLHLAAEQADDDAAAGAILDVNFSADNGITALHLAARRNNARLVERLLALGASVRALSRRGCSALLMAVEGDGHLKSAGQHDEGARMQRTVEVLLAADARYMQLGPDDTAKAWTSPLVVDGAVPAQQARSEEVGERCLSRTKRQESSPLHGEGAGSATRSAPRPRRSARSNSRLSMRLVNLPNDDGIAPLAQACRYAKSVVVETLLHAQADVNAQGHNNGQTALMVASSLSRVVVVKLLLQHGADPALCIEHESRLVVRSALEAACSIRKSSAVIKVLASHDPALVSLASKADGCTALHRACAVGNGESVTALLHHKADPTVANNDGFEPLHLASMGGHDLVVRVLLARDAVNVDAHVRPPTRSGRYDYLSPLMLAAAGNHTDACTALLDAGAEVLYKRPRPFGDSALFSAARFGSVEATNLLLERGATIEDTDLKGRSSLHYAARGGFARVLLRLAAVAGPLANIQGTDGDTPLHAAVRNGHLECVKMLVCQPGLDPSLENQEGLTALALAQKADDQDLVEFLRTVMATGHRTGMLQTNDSPY